MNTESTTYSDDGLLEDLRHERAIRRALMRYCRGIDRKDLSLMASAYHSDAEDDHGSYQGNIPGLVDWVRNRHKTVTQSMHVLGHSYIERVGSAAAVETYCVAFQSFSIDDVDARRRYVPDTYAPGEALHAIVAVRYLDKFECRDGDWRIAKRVTLTESVHPDAVVQPSGARLGLGSRDRSDPLWTLRSGLGLPDSGL